MNFKEKRQLHEITHRCKGRMIVICPYGIRGQKIAQFFDANGIHDYLCVDSYRTGDRSISMEEFIKNAHEKKDRYIVVLSAKNQQINEEITDVLVRAGLDKNCIRDGLFQKSPNHSKLLFDLGSNIKSAIDKRQRISHGKKLVRNITNSANEGELYLFSLANIGDTLALAAFSSHVKSMYRADRLILICKRNHIDIAKMFGSIDDCIPLDNYSISSIMEYSLSTCDYYGKNYIIGNYRLFDRTYDYFENRTIQFKSLILQIPESCTVDSIVWRDDCDNEQMLEKWKNAVIISPYAYSFKLLDWEFWCELVKEISNHGFEVYTNVSGNEWPVRGSTALDVGLKEMFNIGYYCRALISFRSGFSDFMSFNHKLKHIVISPNEFEVRFSNIEMYGSSNICNVIWNNNPEEITDLIITSL